MVQLSSPECFQAGNTSGKKLFMLHYICCNFLKAQHKSSRRKIYTICCGSTRTAAYNLLNVAAFQVLWHIMSYMPRTATCTNFFFQNPALMYSKKAM